MAEVAQPTPGNPFAVAQARIVKKLADEGEHAAANGLAWAYSCWVAEVAQRPLVNVHRRTLDDTWRQVIRYFGGDEALALISAPHDELVTTYRDLGMEPATAAEQWRPMETAPTDDTMVRLLVDYSGEDACCQLEDAQIAETIGINTDSNTGLSEGWKFAGWSWEQDCFCQGQGKPIGWLPLAPVPPGVKEGDDAER